MRILNPVDNMTRVAVSRAIGEGVFRYDYTWRTNSDIIGSIIGCMVREKIEKWDIIRLCLNIFNPLWLVGLEEAVMSIDLYNNIPPPEIYMNTSPGPLMTYSHLFRPVIYICDLPAFHKVWDKMKASIFFLIGWRGISENDSMEWLHNYLTSTRAYIEPGTNFDHLPSLFFCIPNMDKSSKIRTEYVIPPGFQVDEELDIAEIIMVSSEIGEDTDIYP